MKSLEVGVNIGNENICVLLYADDLVFLNENENDLQKMLDTLNIWCCNNDLVVNLDKSKIVHFRTQSTPRSNFQFVFDNTIMEIVSQYTYLGLLLTEYLDYSMMAKAVAKSASRSLGLLIAKCKANGGFQYDVFTKLFNSLVMSVIEYGAAIWGTKDFSYINAVKNRAMRFFMGVGKYTPNLSLYGDMGWKPCNISQWSCVIRLWSRFTKMTNCRINKKVFLWGNERCNSKFKNWNYRVHVKFKEINMEYLCNTDTIIDKNMIKCIENINFCKYKEKWLSDLMKSERSKLRTYRLFKQEFCTEKYLCCNMPGKYKSAYAKFRCGVAPLKIETGRYEALLVENRLCFNDTCIGNNMIESEKHFNKRFNRVPSICRFASSII